MATPEAPVVIDDREELIYVLSEAAELEHGILCGYLFAMWSLRTEPGDGLHERQRAVVAGWADTIRTIAVQEMVHLTLVCNLLTAVGGAPHLTRPNLPQRTRYYPEAIQLSLEPFSAATLQHFLHLERPEGLDEPDAPEVAAATRDRVPWRAPGRVVPGGQEFATVGHLYRGIAGGLRTLVERHGERAVFVGPPRAQATRSDFDFEQLIAVVDLATALEAIDTIVAEGEGAQGHWEDAHYGRFIAVRDRYRALVEEDPDFAPALPVLSNPFVHQPDDADAVNLLSDPFTIAVSDLATAGYVTMLQVLARYFAHTTESDDELSTLASVGVGAMFGVVDPLGRLLARLPAGPDHPGMNAGMSFEVYRTLHLLPHRHAAWTLLHERLYELGADADELSGRAPTTAAGAVLARVAGSLAELAEQLAAHVRERDIG